MDKKLLYPVIRDEVIKACEREAMKTGFNLAGRGQEPRVTLDRTMAAVLKQCSVPRVTISGYGANNFDPARVFMSGRAALLRKLGWAPFEISRGSSVYLVEPPCSTAEGRQP